MTFIDIIQWIFAGIGGWATLWRFWRKGLIGFFMSDKAREKFAAKPPRSSGVKHETYGHKFAPIPTLYKALPSPPIGYAWEIAVEDGKRKDGVVTLLLVCKLLNVQSSEVVAEKSADLIYSLDSPGFCDWSATPSWSTWKSRYQRDPSDANRSAKYRLVRDFETWAFERVSKINDTNYSSGEYMMKGA